MFSAHTILPHTTVCCIRIAGTKKRNNASNFWRFSPRLPPYISNYFQEMNTTWRYLARQPRAKTPASSLRRHETQKITSSKVIFHSNCDSAVANNSWWVSITSRSSQIERTCAAIQKFFQRTLRKFGIYKKIYNFEFGTLKSIFDQFIVYFLNY